MGYYINKEKADIVRYDRGERAEDIVFDRKSDFPAKKVITPIQEAKFVLMDCHGGDEGCFCASMGQNSADDFCMSFYDTPEGYEITAKDPEFEKYFTDAEKRDTKLNFTEKNDLSVTVPEISDREVFVRLKKHPMWREFDKPCI